MKIAFLLDSFILSGGNIVILEHANWLTRRGHDIALVSRTEFQDSDLDWSSDREDFRMISLLQAQKESFDIAVATFWYTVYEIATVPARTYAYFSQSIETRFYPPVEEAIPLDRGNMQLCEASYTLPLNFVTEATWIQEYLLDKFGQEARLVRNGINKSIFTLDGPASERRSKSRLRVLVEGNVDFAVKNVPRTVELCRQSDADEVWLLTSSRIERFPGVDRVFSHIPLKKTAEVYRSCDVIVKLSYVEGMFGPPLEMFHCGGTAIVYDVSGHDEYIVDGGNGIVIPSGNESEVVQAINRLKMNPVLMERLKSGALETANKWKSWEASSLEFEKVCEEFLALPGVSRRNLESLSRILMNYKEIHVQFETERITVSAKLRKLILRIVRKIFQKLRILSRS